MCVWWLEPAIQSTTSPWSAVNFKKHIKDVWCKLVTVLNGVLPHGWALNLSPGYGYVYWSHWHTWRGGRTYGRWTYQGGKRCINALVRTYGRSWRHGYKTKFSHIDGLPYFLNYGAPRARSSAIKDGAYYCYCAYVLRISRYSDFLSVMLTNTGIFLRGLKLSEKSRY